MRCDKSSQRLSIRAIPVTTCSLMVHGSYANQTARPRRAVVINAFRDGVVSASDTPLLEGVPPIPNGHKISGQFFPLLFDPNVLATKT